MSSPATEPPTARQLRYLRTLADRTGTTFTNPATRSQASAQIRALKARRRDPHRPWQASRHEGLQSVAYGTAVDPSEIEGYGSSAHWRTSRSLAEPADGEGERN